MKRALSLFVCAAGVTFARGAFAADDGAYGRLDGDIGIRVGAGVAFASGGPAFAANASAMYIDMAGVYALYTDSLGSDVPLVRRSLATGIRLEPLFLARYATNREQGPPHLDLFLDSLAFDIGAFWAAPRGGSLLADPGLELGLGLAFPILASANGPFIETRGAFRWRKVDLAGSTQTDVVDRGALLTITLAWHQIFRGHVVDAGDRKPR